MRRNCISYGLFRVCRRSFIGGWHCSKVIPVLWDCRITQRIEAEIYLVVRWLFIRPSHLYVCYLGKCKRRMESHNAREGYILRGKCVFLSIWSGPLAIFSTVVCKDRPNDFGLYSGLDFRS